MASMSRAVQSTDAFSLLKVAVNSIFPPTASLSQQVGVIRKQTPVLPLVGQPNQMMGTLEQVKVVNGKQIVPGYLAAAPHGIDPIVGVVLRNVARGNQSLPAEMCAAAEDLTNRLTWSIRMYR